jgi:tetratricopeptide (TPR) repeat protein
MIAAALASLFLAQGLPAAAPNAAEPALDPRLEQCLQLARTDPATAITTASQWLEEAQGLEEAQTPATSQPRQCLGQAYVSLLRWEAAVEQFTMARDARPEGDRLSRARYGAMGGNAALASEDAATAVPLLDQAMLDAREAGDRPLAGEIAVDLAVARYGAGDAEAAAATLEEARKLAPQYAPAWHISSMLARNTGDLVSASNYIATALALAPKDPDIGIEAGLVAALAGDDATARNNFEAVLANAPGTPHAEAAQAYLKQLDNPPSQQ